MEFKKTLFDVFINISISAAGMMIIIRLIVNLLYDMCWYYVFVFILCMQICLPKILAGKYVCVSFV